MSASEAVTHRHSEMVSLRIPAKPEWVAVARLAAAAVANTSTIGFSAEEIEDIKLAVAEACAICITAGPSGSSIDVTCDVDGTDLRVEVRDGRYRLSEDARLHAHSSSVADAEADLGVFLIEALMDKLEHHLDPVRGAELIMIKRAGT